MAPLRRSWLLGVAITLSTTSCVAAPIEECPGYAATNVVQSGSKLTADLDLAGDPCDTYGSDIENLQLEVTYETGLGTLGYSEETLALTLYRKPNPCQDMGYRGTSLPSAI